MAHSMRIRKGDQVRVIAGKDRGKSGRVLRVQPDRGRVFVEGLNMVKRHMRPQREPDSGRGAPIGGVIEKEGPIHVSNVMALDPKDSKPTRVRVERSSGRKVRVAKRSGNPID